MAIDVHTVDHWNVQLQSGQLFIATVIYHLCSLLTHGFLQLSFHRPLDGTRKQIIQPIPPPYKHHVNTCYIRGTTQHPNLGFTIGGSLQSYLYDSRDAFNIKVKRTTVLDLHS